MPLSSFLSRTKSPSAIDYANQAAEVQQQQALNQQKMAATELGMQSAQEELANKRRSMAISMLGGLADEPDPMKQSQLYATLKPMAERYDPTLKLPDQYDASLTRVLTGGQIDPKTRMMQQVELEKAQMLAQATPVAVFDPSTGQQTYVPKSEVLQGGYQPPAAAPKVRPLPNAAIKDLEAKAKYYEDMTRLTGGFKPEFGGNTLTGGLENTIGRLGGETLGITDQGQTQWWQDYQGYVNQVRNDLFGSALTPTEKAEFEKAIVIPGMDPDQIAANLARQQALTQNALARSGNVYRKSGYDPEVIGEFVPEGLDLIDVTSPAINGAPRQRRVQVVTPDGQIGTIDAADLDEFLAEGGKVFR